MYYNNLYLIKQINQKCIYDVFIINKRDMNRLFWYNHIYNGKTKDYTIIMTLYLNPF